MPDMGTWSEGLAEFSDGSKDLAGMPTAVTEMQAASGPSIRHHETCSPLISDALAAS